jgi:hypothetical protein
VHALRIVEACSLDAHVGAVVVGHLLERVPHVDVPPVDGLCAWRHLLCNTNCAPAEGEASGCDGHVQNSQFL